MGELMIVRIVSLLIGYAFGNILSAFVVAKFFGQPAPTEFGSGNPGTANVGAVLGKKAGILVLIGDLFKTLVALVLVQFIFTADAELAMLYAGLGLTLGHDFPFWQKFKGGKGVAVSVLFMLIFDWRLGLIELLVALFVLVVSQNLTVPPILALLLMTAQYMMRGDTETMYVFLVLTLIMIWQFRTDLKDLVQGNAKKVDILKSTKQRFKNKL